MSSPRRAKPTSSPKSMTTSEPEQPSTNPSETSTPVVVSEAIVSDLETELQKQLDLSETPSESPGPTLSPESTRKFTMVVTGTTPGLDLPAEREAIVRNLEMALMGLHVTHGIVLIGLGYRSDPAGPSNESAPTGIVLAAPVMLATTPIADEVSPSASSSPGDSDSSQPSSDDSPSTSDNTAS